ncbi:MAG: hypothetical protein WA876_01715 [Candidatus Acidiferrales bacterium]
MIALEAEPLDLGQDVRAVGLDLVEGADREPVRGEDAARVWSMALPAIAGNEPWVLDFFSHLDRVREFCQTRKLEYREASKRSMVIPSLQADALHDLFKRFEAETFGMRAGSRLDTADGVLENELARQGVDAYHSAYPSYFFCAVCNFEDGSVVVLSDSLWASEVVRRVRPTLKGLEIQVRLAV